MISRWQAGFAFALILLGGYAVADALDVAPGILTFSDPPADPLSQPVAQQMIVAEPAEIPAVPLSLTEEDVMAAIEGLQNDERNTGQVAAVVSDAGSGDVIATFRSESPKLPASNMKLVTAAAALAELGPNTTFPTTAVLQGDQLFLVGGGDILLSPTVGNDDLIVGHAGLKDLAAQTAATLKELGQTQVALAVDGTLFSGPGYHPLVQGSDQVFVMNLGPIAVNGGVRDGARLREPGRDAGEIFAAALEEEGIQVVGQVSTGSAPAPTSDNTVGQVQSAPVRDLVDHMLTDSDNSVAEVLGHMVAISRGKSADFDGAAQAVYETIAEQGWDLTNVTVSDSSGLSMDNRITAALLNDILTAGLCDDCAFASIPASMPTSGLSGTLADRFTDSDSRGLVHAKTGTLIRANSLSGYATSKDGSVFVFSILIDDIEPGTTRMVRPALDDAVAKLAGTHEG